jgi:hypothetical protein
MLLVALGALIAIGVALLVRNDVFRGSSGSTVLQGSNVAATQTRTLATFASVDLAGSNNVRVHVGGKQRVVVHADGNLLRHVTTEVRSGTLVVGTKGSFTTRSPMSVDVSVPSLERLTLSGSGIVAVEGFTGPALTVTLSGSGVLRAAGSTTRLDVTLEGSGDAQLAQLVARDVHAVVTGSGRILVTVTGSLDASVPGTGAIVYRGAPAHVSTSVTGTGVVTRG